MKWISHCLEDPTLEESIAIVPCQATFGFTAYRSSSVLLSSFITFLCPSNNRHNAYAMISPDRKFNWR